MSHHQLVPRFRAASGCVAAGRRRSCWLSAAVSTQRPRFYRDDPIAREPESQDASKAQPYDIKSIYEMTYNLFVTAGSQAVGRAREEHQHDRRGAGLELVHQPDRHHARSRAEQMTRGANVGAPPDPSSWVLIQREDRRRASRLHGAGRQRRDLVPRVRSAVSTPKAPPAAVAVATQDLLGARLQPGRVVPDHVRSEARSSSIRRPRFVVRPARGRRSRTDDMNAILERVARNPDGTYRVDRRPSDPRQDPRQLPASRARAPTIPTTSCRTSTAASCARCACSARGPTSPTSRRRTRSTRCDRERPHGRQALPAGRRLDVRHVQRAATNGI